MLTYKCISCGATKESNDICSCPVCGYRMFPTPYNRRDVLISEVEKFVFSLQVTTVTRERLFFKNKASADNRFPNYSKIVQYVAGQNKAEGFLRNLLETAEQLQKHFSTDFAGTYAVSFNGIDHLMAEYDRVLPEAVRILAPDADVPPLEPVPWEQTSLIYTETQNGILWPLASDLIHQIEPLAKKITAFIRLNNLYGDSHKYHPQPRGNKLNDKTDFERELENAIAQTTKILKKTYVVDIMDDGTEELKEMLTCLWRNIELIMSAPLFIKEYRYSIGVREFSEPDFMQYLAVTLRDRYAAVNCAVNLPLLLADKTEEQIFAISKDMIGLDKFGILVPLGTTLVNIGESEQKLNALIGLAGIKESIKKIKAYALANRDSADLNIHMCFLGNPGTGKTEVARYIAGILYENKILPTKKVVEVDRSGLVSQYFGATAEKTRQVIDRAMGGVLFIDEAYALGNNSDQGLTDYGKEAIDTLVKAMEDYRGKFCVILAGYKNEMQRMIEVNPGFKSRIQFMLDFPNYSREELQSITEMMLSHRKYTIGEAAMSRILDVADVKRKEPNFANAREVRNILDQVIMCQNMRRVGAEDREIGMVDVNKYIQDAKINLPTSGEGTQKKILTGEEELDLLIGLASVKRMVRKIKAYAKRNKGEDGFNLHMCFLGNPGTGKTEVARILSRVLYDAGVLDEAKLVETDGHGLLGKFVGETAPKTSAKINEAMGGVLFIDEAYSLTGSQTIGGSSNYGEEAIAVLLKEMEDRRGQFCTILAGYQEEMRHMLSANPGFESRIQFTLEFPDYTREELEQIAALILAKKKYSIESDALELVLDVCDYYRGKKNFANARTLRNVLDQVIMNQNLRTEDTEDDDSIIRSDVEDYIADENIHL